MTGKSVVATTTFYDHTGNAYIFPKHDVHNAGTIYLAWATYAKNCIRPIREEMALANWSLFRSLFPQFALATDADISAVADDMAEEEIWNNAAKRAHDPVWMNECVQGMRAFCEYIKSRASPAIS